MPNHSETRILPFTASQMFELVADVRTYPEFLPWTAAARIRSFKEVAEGQEITADLVISFKVFREKFTSKVSLFKDII